MMDTVARSQIRELTVRIQKMENLIEMNSLRITDLTKELSCAIWVIKAFVPERYQENIESIEDLKQEVMRLSLEES